MIVCF